MILEGDIGNIMKKEISSDDIGGRYWKYHEKKEISSDDIGNIMKKRDIF